jgi:DNA-binding NarL/FixJ family response regulator
MGSLDGNGNSEPRIGSSSDIGSPGVRRRNDPQRVILLLTNTGSVSDRLIDAVEREFPQIIVEQVDHVDAALATFSHPVALILIDFSFLGHAEAASADLKRAHPHALIAAIQPSEKCLADTIECIAGTSLFRGILPMDLRLDIWLAILRLMLCGGEYIPPGAAIPLGRGAQSSKPPADTGRGQAQAPGVAKLTARETQILARAAQGMQNKLIAAEFKLSEHTVKVHLHNIIRKLGVHNRTEAAARFRNASVTGA